MDVNVQGMWELEWESGLAGRSAMPTDGREREERLGRLTEVTLATSHCTCSLLTVCGELRGFG